MRKSNLPEVGENLFQKVKRQCAAAEENGMLLTKVSIGQPSGPALLQARVAAAEAIMSDKESMHEYQDNGSPGVPDFARRFVQAHVEHVLTRLPPGTVDYLPIPGIKPMIGVVIQAMGGWCGTRSVNIATMTKPGYPTPADQCEMQKSVRHIHLPMDAQNGFLFDLAPTGNIYPSLRLGQGDLIMLNFPHNPTGIVAKEEWLRELCETCEKNGIYLFNDAAYSILTHTSDAVTLTDVAADYPNLNWAEAFSASKAGNMTGWRIGAMVGSPEFIGDIKRIKGNTDSGFPAPLAAGVIELFENHRDEIMQVAQMYESRIDHLTSMLVHHGMRLAVEPEAGFFLLFDAPKRAFGQNIASGEEFNNLMINKTGIVGVPFGPWIRYAICATDVFVHEDVIHKGFIEADVAY